MISVRAHSMGQGLSAATAQAAASFPVITPSLPARSLAELEALADSLAGVAQMLQVDMVDGVFAPHLSWPFTEAHPRESLPLLASLSARMPLELDCMIMHPEQYLDAFDALGIRSVIVHKGSTDAYAIIVARLHDAGIAAGIAATADTADEGFFALVPLFDFVQVMGIVQVGAQGQPFDERVVPLIEQVRTAFPDTPLSVDGAVNETTISRLKAAGATRFAPGSVITRATDPAAAFRSLAALAA